VFDTREEGYHPTQDHSPHNEHYVWLFRYTSDDDDDDDDDLMMMMMRFGIFKSLKSLK